MYYFAAISKLFTNEEKRMAYIYKDLHIILSVMYQNIHNVLYYTLHFLFSLYNKIYSYKYRLFLGYISRI